MRAAPYPLRGPGVSPRRNPRLAILVSPSTIEKRYVKGFDFLLQTNIRWRGRISDEARLALGA